MVNVKKCFLSHNHEVTAQSAEIQLIPLSVVHVCRRLVLSWGWIKFDILCEVWRSAEMRRWDQTWAGTGGRERAEAGRRLDRPCSMWRLHRYSHQPATPAHGLSWEHCQEVKELHSDVNRLLKRSLLWKKINLQNSYINNIVIHKFDINLNLNQNILQKIPLVLSDLRNGQSG